MNAVVNDAHVRIQTMSRHANLSNLDLLRCTSAGRASADRADTDCADVGRADTQFPPFTPLSDSSEPFKNYGMLSATLASERRDAQKY